MHEMSKPIFLEIRNKKKKNNNKKQQKQPFMASELQVFYVNSVDPGQTPRSAASDWFFTVCKCPFYGSLRINWLKYL